MGSAAADGRLGLGWLVTFATAAVSTSAIAFGGLTSWALDGGAAPVAAVLRLRGTMGREGALKQGPRPAAAPAREIRFRHVTFGYPNAAEPVLAGFDLTIPAGQSLAIVGHNGAGKTTIAKLLCRLYDPQEGAIEIDGIDLATLDLAGWRSCVTAVFQDFIRFELPLRDNVAPAAPRMRRSIWRSIRPVRWAWPSWARCSRAVSRRHGLLGRPVAARGPGAGTLRRAAGGGRGAPR